MFLPCSSRQIFLDFLPLEFSMLPCSAGIGLRAPHVRAALTATGHPLD